MPTFIAPQILTAATDLVLPQGLYRSRFVKRMRSEGEQQRGRVRPA